MNDRAREPAERIVVELDDPELAELVPLFLENRERDVENLVDALERGDFATVKRLGHNMKGAGAGYGFDAITEMGAALERAGDTEDAAATREATTALARYLARLDVYVAGSGRLDAA